jgi:DNA-binding Lrp family transcriptional regulator
MFRKFKEFGTNVSKNVKSLDIRSRIRNAELGGEFVLDEIDKKILRALTADSRMSLRDIASYTDISVGTVREHLSRIQKSGVIKAHTTMLDPLKVGYKMTAIIEVFQHRKGANSVEKSVVGQPNVCGVYNVTGNTDVLIIARFRDSDELNAFVKRILRMENVARTETLIVLDTFKEDFRAIV